MALYRDMTPEQRKRAFDELQETRIRIEGWRAPSPVAVRYCILQERLIMNVARKAGDEWAKHYA